MKKMNNDEAMVLLLMFFCALLHESSSNEVTRWGTATTLSVVFLCYVTRRLFGEKQPQPEQQANAVTKVSGKEILALILVYMCALLLAQKVIGALERGIVKDLAMHDVSVALLDESFSYKVMMGFARSALLVMIGVVPYIGVKRLFGKKQP